MTWCEECQKDVHPLGWYKHQRKHAKRRAKALSEKQTDAKDTDVRGNAGGSDGEHPSLAQHPHVAYGIEEKDVSGVALSPARDFTS